MDALSTKSPPLVSIVVVPPTPILTPSIYASENDLLEVPKYASTSASGTRPSWTVAIPVR